MRNRVKQRHGMCTKGETSLGREDGARTRDLVSSREEPGADGGCPGKGCLFDLRGAHTCVSALLNQSLMNQINIGKHQIRNFTTEKSQAVVLRLQLEQGSWSAGLKGYSTGLHWCLMQRTPGAAPVCTGV